MAVFTYDPKQFTMIVGGAIMSGFADDDFVEVERDEDAFSKKVGVDGEVTRAKTNNKAGKITIRLMQSSSSNDELSAFALLDEASNKGVVPVLARDASGRSVFASDSGWVRKFPKATYKKGVNVMEWVIDTGSLDIFEGGN